jgi:hypothetical protein
MALSSVNNTLLLPAPAPKAKETVALPVKFDVAGQQSGRNANAQGQAIALPITTSLYADNTASEMIFGVESYGLTGEPGGLSANDAAPLRGALYNAIV